MIRTLSVAVCCLGASVVGCAVNAEEAGEPEQVQQVQSQIDSPRRDLCVDRDSLAATRPSINNPPCPTKPVILKPHLIDGHPVWVDGDACNGLVPVVSWVNSQRYWVREADTSECPR